MPIQAYLSAMDFYFLIGVTLIFLGLMVLLIYIFMKKTSGETSDKTKTDAGMFILIGPFPIVISSNKKLGYALLIIGILLALSVILLVWLIS
ncbi:MAG TPA: DUF131 domain-containing protein [Geobacterales bacterium]|nr:DUF131 domain-containing protein [Geobacterales bacterium]